MFQSCHNSTDCFNDGECKYDNVDKYNNCVCKIYFDSSTGCNTTIFEQYQGLDLIYPGISIPLYFLLLGLYTLEFSMDIIRRKISPILLTKGILLIFIVSRVINMFLWVISSINRTTKYAQSVVIMEALGALMLITADILIIVSWLDLVLKAKHLGQVDIKMLKVKKGLFVTISILTPTVIVAGIFNEIMPQSILFLSVTIIMLMIFLIISIIISVIYLVRIYKWLKDNHKSKLAVVIRRKSKWIIVLLLMLVNVVFFLVLFFVIRRDSPTAYLTMNIVIRFVEFIIAGVMLLFLENSLTHLFKKGSLNIVTSGTTNITPVALGSKPNSSSTTVNISGTKSSSSK